MTKMNRLAPLKHFDEVFAENLPIDGIAESLMPPDLKTVFRALKSTGNGNCLFNSCSIALIGDESLATELRLRAAHQLIANKRDYHFSVNDLNYTWYEITDEIISTLTDYCWGGPIQMLALAQVLHRHIVCFDCHYSRELSGKCSLVNCIVQHPGMHKKYLAVEPKQLPIYLLFSNASRGAKQGNHFVPLLRIQAKIPFPNLARLKNNLELKKYS